MQKLLVVVLTLALLEVKVDEQTVLNVDELQPLGQKLAFASFGGDEPPIIRFEGEKKFLTVTGFSAERDLLPPAPEGEPIEENEDNQFLAEIFKKFKLETSSESGFENLPYFEEDDEDPVCVQMMDAESKKVELPFQLT